MTNRLVKKIISDRALTVIAVIFFAAYKPSIAQQDNLIDILPLEIGNKWTYYYESGGSNSTTHSAGNTKGTVDYEIIGKFDSNDSTIWQIFKTRDVVSNVYGIPNPIYTKDSEAFTIVELKSGNHEVYTPVFEPQSIFPFRKTQVDTSKFFRYLNGNSDDTLITFLNLQDPSNPSFGNFNYKYKFHSLANVGTVFLRYKKSAMMSSSSAEHNLIRFRKVTEGPSIGLPNHTVNIETLFGTPIDTTIQIWNDGKQSLEIFNVSSNDSRISVIDYSRTIPPLLDGFIKLRFNTAVEEVVNAAILVSTNSITSESSFNVSGSAYAAAIIQVNPSNGLFFGSLINGNSKILTYSISNSGNAILKIDSVKINAGNFVNKIISAAVNPGESVFDTVTFFSEYTGFYSAELFIYSSASTSPYRLYLTGQSGEEIQYSINNKGIIFNNVQFGEIKDSLIYITNLGKEPFYISLDLQSELNGNYSSLFSYSPPENLHDGLLYPNETAGIKIMFRPFNSISGEDKLRIKFFSPYLEESKTEYIELAGNLSFHLSQNYPNPFNDETKIKFSISSKTEVSLKIYDILGREVAELLNEELGSGIYEKIFRGNGLTSGVYFYCLKAGGNNQTRKLILLK